MPDLGFFTTVINCMDGRVQQVVMDWMSRKTDCDHVDLITEAGPNGILAKENHALIDNILARIHISRDAHGSRHLGLAAHHDCAGNPVDRAEQIIHLEQAAKRLQEAGLGMKLYLLWVDESWQVNLLEEMDI